MKMVLDKAETDNYYKYAVYGARILAVKHPEIYLRADGLFVEMIETNPGFKKAYQINDVHSDYFIWYYIGGEMSGPPFSFDYVDFTKYQIIEAKELYAEDYPLLPYLDRRMLPVASTLKSVGNRLTQLEKAEQHYFALKEEGTALDQLYLIYCDNDNAYLYNQGSLLAARDLKKVDQIEGNPILVFNEKNVWYPLMGRDDTAKDATFRQIIDKHATATAAPDLSHFEVEMADRLAQATSLDGFEECGAIIAAARSHDIPRVENRPFRSIWEKFTPLDNYGRASLKREIMKDANYLSPIVAYLAAISEEYTGEAKIEATCQEYVEHATAPGGRWPGGSLWMAGLVEYTVDESYYAHIGDDAVQAANTQAWLDIAGIDSYWLQGAMFEPHSSRHFHVYIPEYDVRVSNGSFDKAPEVYHKSVLPYNPRLSG
ncbi:MAG: hypothetical protein KAX25_06240, partial [Dehalococcoidia bacterium]|nr:hypothetical protein [Dehalococcoidia bacterium]